MDPDVLAELDAIDATLRGEAVDPAYAELAELALLVAADRPQIDRAFAARLDDRVGRRFVTPAPAPGSQRPSPTRWALRPAFGGLAGALVAAVVVVVVIAGGGSPSSYNGALRAIGAPSTAGGTSASLGTYAPHTPATHAGGGGSAASGAVSANSLASTLKSPARTPSSSAKSAAPAATTPGPLTPNTQSIQAPQQYEALAPAPITHGRKQIQSAQLQLTAASNRIQVVSQELFSVVGDVNGVVLSSQITAGAGNGYASFQLSIPSASLAQAMSELSNLRYARVSSRTDQTTDVNGQYQSDVRRLADARALRTSLLKQLAAATTSTQIASLKAQINDAEASISSDEATLRGINHQVDYSNLSVQINSGGPVPVGPTPVAKGSGGFGIGQAAHDAGRVLTVAAGVALIALAALVPVALLAGLGLWIGDRVRRHRREQALDAA